MPFSSFTQDRDAFRPTQGSKYERPCLGYRTFASAKRKILSKSDESPMRNGRLAESESNNHYSLVYLFNYSAGGVHRLARDEPILNTTPGHLTDLLPTLAPAHSP